MQCCVSQKHFDADPKSSLIRITLTKGILGCSVPEPYRIDAAPEPYIRLQVTTPAPTYFKITVYSYKFFHHLFHAWVSQVSIQSTFGPSKLVLKLDILPNFVFIGISFGT